MLKKYLRFVLSIVRSIQQDNCQKHAAALTYTTLFAIVPLLTVVFNMFTLVPAFQDLAGEVQDKFLRYIVPGTSQEIENYLVVFIEKARKLTTVGFLFLAVTALMLLRNIDQTLNGFFAASESRKGVTVFLTYWTVLSLGPVLVGVAFAINAYLVSASFLVNELDVIGLVPTLLNYIPYGLIILAFTFIYYFVPNVAIKFKHAAIGGFFTATVIEFAQFSFSALVGNGNYQNIYGAFAFLPLFLLWIYLTWMIILIGAQIVRALSVFNFNEVMALPDILVALKLLQLFWQKHQTGSAIGDEELLETPWLLDRYFLDGEQWQRLRACLLDLGFIESNQNKQYFLKKDLARVTLAELLPLDPIASELSSFGHSILQWQSAELLNEEDHKEVYDFVRHIKKAQQSLQSQLDVPLIRFINRIRPT